MYFQVFIQILTAMFCIFLIGFFAAKGRRNSLFYGYVVCQMLMFVWTAGQICEIMAANYEIRWLTVQIQYIAFAFIGVSWLILCLIIVGYKPYKNKLFMIGILIVPVITAIMVITNESHYLFFESFTYTARKTGIGFWIQSYYTYLCFFPTGFMLYNKYKQEIKNNKKLCGIITATIMLPVITNVIYTFSLFGVKMDYTPSTFAVTMSVSALLVIKYKFINIMPTVLNDMFNSMHEAVLVADNKGNIVERNKYYTDIIGTWIPEKLCIASLKELTEMLAFYMDKTEENNKIIESIYDNSVYELSAEFYIGSKRERYYEMKIRPIYSIRNRIIGKILCFNDITEYKNRINTISEKNIELEELNNELSQANKQISEYAETSKELAITKERNRVAHEIHDTIGHTMTMLITLMKVAKIEFASNPEQAETKLEQGIELATEGLNEVRNSIYGISIRKQDNMSITDSVKEIIENFKGTGRNIELSVFGYEKNSDKAYMDVIYRICQEATTNSIKHGNADQIDIMLKFTEDKTKVYIIDNGIGCKGLIKGFGLRGMEERVRKMNGTISYGSSGGKGFNIHVEFPCLEV